MLNHTAEVEIVMLDIISVPICQTNLEWRKSVNGSKGAIHIVKWGRLPPGAPTEYGWHCSCKAFVFSKNKTCKHIEKVKHLRCGWNEELSAISEFIEKCPDCGGPVEYIKVGV